MTARVLSVCVGQPKALKVFDAHAAEHLVVTGIYKEPVEHEVWVRAWGLEGDGQADTRVVKRRQVHGGVDQAVYLYPIEHYAKWASEWTTGAFAAPLEHGFFGENLTVEGFDESTTRVGDVLRVGEGLVLQVTHPRGPCYKLDIRVAIPEFRHQMDLNGRTGFYARVLAEGFVSAGDTIEMAESDSSAPTILEYHQRRLA